MLPWADAQAMQMHLDGISRHVARKAHAVVLMDRAGWHTTGKLKVPKNLTIILLPSRAPELNPVENIWQYLRANWLSNRVFEDYNAIVDAGCEAWTSSSHSPKPSHQSECENGPISVNVKCRWYKSNTAKRAETVSSFAPPLPVSTLEIVSCQTPLRFASSFCVRFFSLRAWRIAWPMFFWRTNEVLHDFSPAIYMIHKS